MASPYACPIGNLPGWHQVFYDDFLTNVAVGHFPGTVYDAKWDVYLDTWQDTNGKPVSQGGHGFPSRYYPSKVVKVEDSVLIKDLHTEVINGVSRPLVAALLPIPSEGRDALYRRYDICFKADSLAGYKTAWLLWPQSGVWPRDGEIDWPEGNLNNTIFGYMHRQGATSGSDQDQAVTSYTYTDWHIASTRWMENSLELYMDETLVKRVTARVPNTPMHLVIQTETTLGIQPAADVRGNVYIDWVSIYDPVSLSAQVGVTTVTNSMPARASIMDSNRASVTLTMEESNE